jgi:signal transduction histidine kinase
VSVLVALFISRAFSNPVKQIESEMIKLTDNDYAPSNYNFKNKEMISLQDTLNTIKIDTKNKVESIENQKNDVEKLNNELKNENELRTSFIARLSHELKTPLMIISATTEALADDIIPKDEIKRNYETIIEEVDKTNKIIKDIIGTYKSAKASEMNLKITRFSLNELVKSLLENLLPLAQHKELNVITDIKTQVYMDADKELISQAVSNFITNAFKYTEDKGIVEIKIVSERTSYLFEIKNYGAKILEENLQKIWLPFFRENEGVDKTSTGMGLYVVKEILERHKLEYNVENFDQGVVSWFRIKK